MYTKTFLVLYCEICETTFRTENDPRKQTKIHNNEPGAYKQARETGTTTILAGGFVQK